MKNGTRVIYSQHGVVIGKGEIFGSGKENGMKAYDVELDNGKIHWGYADQFAVIVPEFDESEPPYPANNSYDEAIAILQHAKNGGTVHFWVAHEKRWFMKSGGKGKVALFDFTNTYYRI